MAMKSWVESANLPDSDFPLENLPYGVFRYGSQAHIGVAIGDRVLDLHGCATQGLLDSLSTDTVVACFAESLNSVMQLGLRRWTALRRRLIELLDDSAPRPIQNRTQPLLIPTRDVQMLLPAQIGDYTDFYASIHHATRVGKLFRPDNPLLPNYKYVPIGYHGRASSIVVSGAEIQRPCGQTKPTAAETPAFGLSRSLDYELEVGIFIGPGNRLGRPIPIAEAEQHIFGLCLANDWSARDIQSWEYQPLGPFLSKSFATTISPWLVPLQALAPHRVPVSARPAGDPAPLPYLNSLDPAHTAINITLEVSLQSARMRENNFGPHLVGRSNLRDLYWTLPQLLTHHSSNGCNLRPGDLLATGTISGPDPGSEGCLLELRHNPEPLRLPTGELRRFLEDGDQVTLRAYCLQDGLPRIGFGQCIGTIAGAA